MTIRSLANSLTAKIIIFWTLVTVVTILFFLPVINPRNIGDRQTREKRTAYLLVTGLQQYKSEYGVFPGGGHVALLRALTGDNPKKIVFLEFDPQEKNSKGELIDRWGTPYRIEITRSGDPHASSAGKNKIFQPEDQSSDDVCSWR